MGGGGSESPQADFFGGGPLLDHARATAPLVIRNAFGADFAFFLATVFAPGEVVGGAANFQPTASVALFYPGAGRIHDPLLGQSPYTAYRMTLPDGPHYGWVQWEFHPTPPPGSEIPMYQPIRWAFETDPNVPITVPGPASGAILLTAAGLLGARRRRGVGAGACAIT